MSLRRLPRPEAGARPKAYAWDAPSNAIEAWAETAPLALDGATISIFGMIGEDMFEEGFTARRMAGALRSIGRQPVVVDVNSPGGDMFEGLAIYNLLAAHEAEVTVRVLGVAASAASLIAMAGDRILMGAGTMMMVHRAWGMVIGNRHDFADAAETFDQFDAAMASIYAARTGLDEAAVMALLDGPERASDGTLMRAAEAIERGFADAEIALEAGAEPARAALPKEILARRRIEAALAKEGVSRKDRAALIDDMGGRRDATSPAARDAGDLSAGLSALLTSIRS